MSTALVAHPAPTPSQLAKIDALRAKIDACKASAAEREARISNCEVEWTDCFVSIAANDSVQREAAAQIEILEHGGYALMPVVVDASGAVVATKRSQTTYGAAWYIGGKWYGDTRTPRGKLAKAGFRVEDRWLPAWTTISGTRFNGWHVVVFPVDAPFFT